MKKVVALIILFCLLFCGCANKETHNAVSYPLNCSIAKMGKTLGNYTVAINGKVVNFPIEYGKFTATGFELLSSNKNVTLKSGQYSIYKVSNGTQETEIYVANFGDTKKKLTDCTVCGLLANKLQNISVELPQKITFGSPLNKVKESYGINKNNGKLVYGTEQEGARLEFLEGKLSKIDYFRIVNPEALKISNKVPKQVKEYKDPPMLSADLSKFSFYLYGTTYTMPLPVSRLIKGGWIKAAQKQEYIPSGETVEDAVKLTTGNRTVTFGVKNVANYPTTVENCFITSIKSTTDVKLDLTLANGCRVGATVHNLETTFGKDNFTNIKVNGKYTHYTYIYNSTAKLVVTANNTTGYITKIEIALI